MSKEELLKYLIAEIDLIMHDKDYRFENEDGTWYSRESCKNLTNEEVFEELRIELRQLADLEAKLAESESKVKVGEFWHSAYQGKQLDYDKVYAELRQSYDENEKLKQQLAEKDRKIERLKTARNCSYKQVEIWKHEFAIEQLEKVKEYIHEHKVNPVFAERYIIYVKSLNDVIDNQIKAIKGREVV